MSQGKPFSDGFSLVELLIAFFISMVLLTLLVQQLSAVSRQYQRLHAVLEETMTLQWVFDLVRSRIRHAGFTPCVGLDQLHALDTRDEPEHLKAIELAYPLQPHVATRLVIRKMDETAFSFAEILDAYHLRVVACCFKMPANAFVLIADCEHAEVHEVAQVGESIQLKKPLVFHYAKEVYVGPWVSEAFFLKPGKGLLIQQHRVDHIMPLKQLEFQLENTTVIMRVVTMLGQQALLKERFRM